MPPPRARATPKIVGKSGHKETRSEKFEATLRGQQTSHTWYDIPSVEDLGESGTLTLETVMRHKKVVQTSFFDKSMAPVIKPPTTSDGSVRAMSSVGYVRAWVWDAFENPEGSITASLLNFYIMLLICLSGLIAVIETVPSLRSHKDVWFSIECFFVANFSVELLCRVCSCPKMWDFSTSVMNYVDLVSILPFYLDLFVLLLPDDGSGLNFDDLRILRLGRSFRLLKLSRYSSGLRLVTNAMVASWDALQLFFGILVIVLVVFSSSIYFMERGVWNDTQRQYFRENEMPYLSGPPEGSDPSPFQSIPQSFWWCMVTLTTVGYGDVYPITYIGQVVATITMLVGLIMLALPLSIIGTNFIAERDKIKDEEMQAKNSLAPPKEEDKVQVLQGSRHALVVAEKCIRQATYTVQLQNEMQTLMQQALGICEAMRLDSELEEIEGSSRLGLLETWTPPLMPLMTPKSAASMVRYDTGCPSDLGSPSMVQLSVLHDIEELCAQVIKKSQQTVDAWEEGPLSQTPTPKP